MQAYYNITGGIPMDILIHSCSHSLEKEVRRKEGFPTSIW